MLGDKKFYMQAGSAAILAIAFLVVIAYLPSVNTTKEVEIEIRFSDGFHSKSVKSTTTEQKLFSGKSTTLKFSSAAKNNYFSEKGFECEIQCRNEN
jgi:hypothetical protein